MDGRNTGFGASGDSGCSAHGVDQSVSEGIHEQEYAKMAFSAQAKYAVMAFAKLACAVP
ncbi:hypothetical protein GGR47_001523 [Sphingomonas aquatilis]|uniref:Uncharacterized protein n=1 Tax=Sphingomonas aquatilis TaxID=93063 RepID=A0AAW3TQ67_9SPHN|nr:hypothetical protein [Sphingomonas aquatilis]